MEIQNDEKNQYLSQWENLTVDELLYPNLLYYSRWIMDFMFVITCFSFAFVVFVIHKKSTPAMGKFKYVLLSQLICNMCVETLLCFMNFVVPVPIPIIAAYTHFPINKDCVKYFIVLMVFFGISVVGLFVYAFGYRVSVVLGLNKTDKSERFIKLITIVFNCWAFAGWISISVPLFLLLKNPDETQTLFERNIPALKEIYKFIPVSVGFLLTSENQILGTLLTVLVCLGLGTAALTLLILNGILFYQMKQIKKTVSKETYALQRMLYKYLLIQLLNAIVSFYIPFGMAGILFVFQLKNAAYLGYLPFPFLSFHLFIDCCCLLYYVKPYKIYVQSIFSKPKLEIKKIFVAPSSVGSNRI